MLSNFFLKIKWIFYPHIFDIRQQYADISIYINRIQDMDISLEMSYGLFVSLSYPLHFLLFLLSHFNRVIRCKMIV
jgi:hypothetical protein